MAFLLELFLVFPLYPCAPHTNNELDWLLSVLVEFIFVCLFPSYSGHLLYNSCLIWVLQICHVFFHARCLKIYSALVVGCRICGILNFFRKDFSGLSECVFLAVSAQVRALGGSSVYLVLRITCCVCDNVKKICACVVYDKVKVLIIIIFV